MEPIPLSTIMAEACARALVARSIDIWEMPKVKDGEAREIFQEVRWADTDGRIHCPACGAEKPYEYGTRLIYKCKFCQKQFSLTSGTVFSNRKTTLQNCLVGIGCHGRDDINATILVDVMGVTYNTALNFAHRFGLPKGPITSNLKNSGQLYYPFRNAPSREPGYDLVASINALVPRDLPKEMRADVAQEIALAVLLGDIPKDDIKSHLHKYVRGYNKMYQGKYGDRSLDAVIPGTEDLTLAGKLVGENSFDYWNNRRTLSSWINIEESDHD